MRKLVKNDRFVEVLGIALQNNSSNSLVLIMHRQLGDLVDIFVSGTYLVLMFEVIVAVDFDVADIYTNVRSIFPCHMLAI